MTAKQERNEILSMILLFAISMLIGWAKAPYTKDDLIADMNSIRDKYHWAMRESTRIEDAQVAERNKCKKAEERLFKIHDMKITSPSPSQVNETRKLIQVVENCKPYSYYIAFYDFTEEKIYPLERQAHSCDDQLVKTLSSKPKEIDISEFIDWAQCLGMYVGAVKEMKRRYP